MLLNKINNKIVILLFLLTVLCLLVPVSSAQENNTDTISINNNDYFTSGDSIYVATDGSNDGDGSESNPYLNISVALNDVTSSKNKIIIKNGTYNQSNIEITKSVSIIGEGDVTIDGQLNGLIMKISAGESVILSNLTFINGNGNGGYLKYGGALAVGDYSSNPMLDLTIDNVKFINNTASYGGAVYIGSKDEVNVKIKNSYFENNKANNVGGAIHNVNNGIFEITNTTFINNKGTGSGSSSGAVECGNANTVIISDSIFYKNSATTGYGGAIRLQGGTLNIYSTLFEENSLSSSSNYGTAIYLNGGYLNLNSCAFLNNTPTTNYVICDRNYFYERITAEQCWWGDNNGPGNAIKSESTFSNWAVMKQMKIQ